MNVTACQPTRIIAIAAALLATMSLLPASDDPLAQRKEFIREEIKRQELILESLRLQLSAVESQPTTKTFIGEPIKIKLNNDKIYVNGEPTNLDYLVPRIKDTKKSNPNAAIIIDADPAETYVRVSAVLNALAKEGFTNVALLKK